MVGNALDWIKIETQGAVLIDYSSIIHSKLLQDKLHINKCFDDNVTGGIECAEHCEIILRAFGLALHTLCYRTAYQHDSVPDIFKGMNVDYFELNLLSIILVVDGIFENLFTE